MLILLKENSATEKTRWSTTVVGRRDDYNPFWFELRVRGADGESRLGERIVVVGMAGFGAEAVEAMMRRWLWVMVGEREMVEVVNREKGIKD